MTEILGENFVEEYMRGSLIGCDTGGTFTDFVMYDPSAPELGIRTLKLSSTPDDPGRAVLEGVERLSGGCAPRVVNHATTVATNALLEGQGGRVAFLVTKGFGDLLQLGRGQRQDLYALSPTRVEAPIRDRDTFQVDERIHADGSVLRELQIDEIDGLMANLDPTIDSVAICLLHSGVKPDHELALAEKIVPKFQVFCSHKVAPGSGEYERAMTTVLAAYLSPKIRSYIEHLANNLRESDLMIVHSAGGLLTPTEARKNPHRIALSGPAAGLRGALSIGSEVGLSDLVTLDMGGTSTDVALLANGQLPYSWQTELEGFPLRAPTLEIHTIGAGGGSIAWREETGLLRVGPQSSGAVPGPACYGRGGEAATVTDALCYNGFLPETLGDELLPLQKEKSRDVLEKLGRTLSLSGEESADGILALATNHLAGAVRKVTTAQGYNPASFSLFPFGGAGPLLACWVAESLAMNQILIPSGAGVLSAWGALTAPWEREWSQSVAPSERHKPNAWESVVASLKEQANEELERAEDCRWETLLERRYEGQGETLVSLVNEDFHSLHHRRFGFSRPDFNVETIMVRLRGTREPLQNIDSSSSHNDSIQLQTRRIRWNTNSLEVPVFAEIGQGQKLQGPALIFQPSATIFVAPEWSLERLTGGHLLLTKANPL